LSGEVSFTKVEGHAVKTSVRIVDEGRGPQIAGHRLTVMDVFYYLHRGRDFDFIHRAMPSLTREEFDAVVEYASAHQDELVEEDRLVEERIQREISEQKARGLRRDVDPTIPIEVRMARLKEKAQRLAKERVESNGDHAAG
jgi:uncharacterized protein (DUF433 family)